MYSASKTERCYFLLIALISALHFFSHLAFTTINVEDESTISNESEVEDKKTKSQFRPRYGGRDPKTTTQGVSGTDKDIKEEVEKIKDTSPQTHYSFYLFTVSSSKKGRAVYYIHLHKRTYPYE